MGWVSHLDYFWREPSFARFLTRLASFSRLILFDKRGTGLSDRVSDLPTLEQRMDDVRAVMEAVGSRARGADGRVGGRAAVQPVRHHLSDAHARAGDDRHLRPATVGGRLSLGPTRAGHERFLEEIRSGWGGPVGIEVRAPSRAHDPAFRDWWSTYLRMGASPGAALTLTRMNAEIDVRHVLPADPRADAGAAPHRRSVPESRGGPLRRRPHSRRHVRRAAGRRSPAVRRRPGRDARRDRAVPQPPAARRGRRPRAGHHAGARVEAPPAVRRPARPSTPTPAARSSGSAAVAGQHRDTACAPRSTARPGPSAAPRRWRPRRPLRARRARRPAHRRMQRRRRQPRGRGRGHGRDARRAGAARAKCWCRAP